MALFRVRNNEKPVIAPFSKLDAARSTDRKREENRRKKKFSFGKYLAGFLWMGFFFLLGYVVFFSSFTKIETISFTGMNLIPEERFVPIWEQFASGRRMFFFRNDDYFTLDASALAGEIENLSPWIQSAEVKKVFPSRVTVVVSEFDTLLLWKTGELERVLLPNGMTRSHPNIGAVWNDRNMFVLSSETGQEQAIDQVVMNPESVRFLLQFLSEFRDRFDISLERTIAVSYESSHEVRLRTSEGWDILLDTSFRPESVIETLALSLEKGMSSDERKELSRIDLRINGKAYYSLREKDANTDESEKK